MTYTVVQACDALGAPSPDKFSLLRLPHSSGSTLYKRDIRHTWITWENPGLGPIELIVDVLEEPFFFESDGATLFGMFHCGSDSAPSRVPFLFSHPLVEEKLWSHRAFVALARELAKRGHPILRFDYRGAGDSSGDISETSIASHLTDLRSAIAELSRRTESAQIGLLGLRLGATLAALVAEDPEELPSIVGPLVLWDPILDGAAYMQEILRTNLGTQLAVYGSVRENREALQARIESGETVNVDGYEIGQALFSSCRADLLTSDPKRHLGNTLVVQIASTANQKDRVDLQSLAAAYANGSFARCNEQPFWREIKPFYATARSVAERTLAWLEDRDV